MFKENISLATLGSYRIGGPARYFSMPQTMAGLAGAIREAKKNNLDMFVLGGGTNVLPKDDGFEGLVLKPDLRDLAVSGENISAGAGVPMAELLNYSITHSLSGLEWAGGLPGTLGGAIRGNAGAFGGEMKDVVKSVRSIHTDTLEEIEREASACDFEYRSSVFKKANGREIITSAVLRLKKGDLSDIRRITMERIAYRETRHPMEYPNIGSIFKNVPVPQIDADIAQINADTINVNPRGDQRISAFTAPVKNDPFPVVPAAYLISEAALKGVSFGGAMISPKHPNFIVNVLDAKASDVETLIGLVKNEVRKKFGVVLEEEIIRI